MAMPFNTNTPHDRLMKKIAEKAPRIRAIIDDHVVPLRGMVKGDPQPVSENFTDSESLQGIHCDIAVQVDLEHGPPNRAILIFEHKSAPDDLTPLQLLKYAIACLDRYVGGDPEKMKDLPSILSIVLYHGKRKWDMPECLDVSLGEGEPAVGLR
ncbi:MAG: Rpn family recombination-promoting nuclease/putative transposase, partial [Pseudomonadales bacterium]